MTTSSQIELATRVYNHIVNNPKSHKQDSWASEVVGCGTTGCVAGWTLMLSDLYEPIIDHSQTYTDEDEDGEKITYFSVDGFIHTQTQEVYEEWKTEPLARELLGLSEDDAYRIFSCEDKEVALEAIRLVSEGKEIDWDAMRERFGDWGVMY